LKKGGEGGYAIGGKKPATKKRKTDIKWCGGKELLGVEQPAPKHVVLGGNCRKVSSEPEKRMGARGLTHASALKELRSLDSRGI